MADIKRTNYFDRQFLRAKDFQDEQAYHLDQQRRHNRLLHTPGVAEGLLVTRVNASTVRVAGGTALDPQGRVIVLSAERLLSIPSGTTATRMHLRIAYGETASDPSTDPGVTGQTRMTEIPSLPLLKILPDPADTPPPDSLLLAELALTGGQITEVNNAVRTMASTVISAIISDGSITEPKLAPNAVSPRTLLNNAVTSRAMAPADAGADQTLTTGSGVKTGHVKDQAITTVKLADNAVITAKLADNAVTATELANNAVTTAKLQSHPSDNAQRAVGKLHIQDNAVSIAQLSATPVFDNDVSVQANSEQPVFLQTGNEDAFYLISTRFVGPPPPLPPAPPTSFKFTWVRRNTLFRNETQRLVHHHELVIQNPNAVTITVHVKAYRLSET